MAPDWVCYLDGAVVGLFEAGHAVGERQMDAMLLQVGFNNLGMFFIDGRQHLVEHFHQGDVKAAMHQVFHHFQADEATTDNDGSGLGSEGLESGITVDAGQKGVAFFNPFTDFPGIRYRPDVKNTRQVYARQGRTDRYGAG